MRTKGTHIKLVEAEKALNAPKAHPSLEVADGGADWAALVRRASAGDLAAFEQLAGRHYQAVFAFALGLARDPAEAADVAQEALVKAFRKLDTYRFVASFRSWLLQITRNTFRDRLRQKQQFRAKIQHLADHTAQAGSPDPEKLLMDKQISRHLHGALMRVEPQFREVVVLFDLQGFAYREIAEICGVPMGTVKSRLRRGRDRLRQLLVDDGAIGHRASAPSKGGRRD